MKKLFESVGGNKFKLLTESVKGQEHVASGLKKVFSGGNPKISYKQVESVGLGYINDVGTAQRVALQEAKEMASQFGYKDDENAKQFVKSSGAVSEDGNVKDDDDDVAEVKIALEIQKSLGELRTLLINNKFGLALENKDIDGKLEQIRLLAIKIIERRTTME
jgi:hypothetical protein